MRIRRVGSITLGISLLVFGSIYLLRLFTNAITYEFILHLWPLILIFLGLEILITNFTAKNEEFKYDGWAILILIVLISFAMCMASMEFAMEYAGYRIEI